MRPKGDRKGSAGEGEEVEGVEGKGRGKKKKNSFNPKLTTTSHAVTDKS